MDHNQTKKIFEDWNIFLKEAEMPQYMQGRDGFVKSMEKLFNRLKKKNPNFEEIISKLNQIKRYVENDLDASPMDKQLYKLDIFALRDEIEKVLRGNTLPRSARYMSAKEREEYGKKYGTIRPIRPGERVVTGPPKVVQATTDAIDSVISQGSGIIYNELKTWDAIDWTLNILFLVIPIPSLKVITSSRVTSFLGRLFAPVIRTILPRTLAINSLLRLSAFMNGIAAQAVFFLAVAYVYGLFFRFVEKSIRDALGIPEPPSTFTFEEINNDIQFVTENKFSEGLITVIAQYGPNEFKKIMKQSLELQPDEIKAAAKAVKEYESRLEYLSNKKFKKDSTYKRYGKIYERYVSNEYIYK